MSKQIHTHIKHNYLSRNLVFALYISTASRSLLQQTEGTDVSHDQCHVTQAGVGLVGAPGQLQSAEEDCGMQLKYTELTLSFLRGNYA